MSGRARRVAVLFGGPSPEHDVSILTGLQAVRALREVREVAEIHALYWTKTGSWCEVPTGVEAAAFLSGAPDGATPLELLVGPGGGFVARRGRLTTRFEPLGLDAAIVCCHGGPGEDGALQGVLDLLGLPYSGPSAAGAALGMDKLATTGILQAGGIPVLPRTLLVAGQAEPAFAGPYIVKPRYGGSSIGIEVVADYSTALARLGANVHLRRGAVIEPYRPDLFDLQVAVRTWPKPALSAIERPLRRDAGAEILDYRDKYVGGEGMLSAPRELPAQLDAGLERELREAALLAAGLLGARGVNRIDFLSDGDRLYLNEINTIPGSLSRHLFVEPPVAFAELLAGMLDEALARPAAQLSSAGADGTVLRSAGAIAAKLS